MDPTLSPPPLQILLMDDEPHQTLIRDARERLAQAGHQVDYVETIEAAIEAYYRKFYDLFILDIDMSHLAQEGEGDGVQLLKRLVSLHNQTRIILFSGAGRVHHWFEAINAHAYGYIAKDESRGELDSIDLLLERVEAARQHPPLRPLPAAAPPSTLLLGGVAGELLERAATDLAPYGALTLGGSLLDCAARADLASFGVIVLIQPQFQLRAAVKQALQQILAHQPTPQVIIATDSHDESQREAILFLANHHPFRLIPLAEPSGWSALTTAVTAARRWYGREERLPSDPELLRRLPLTLPAELTEEESRHE